MELVLGLVVVLSCLVGVAMTLAMLPGIWVMVGVAVACDVWRPELFSIWTLIAVVALGLLAEGLELAASAAGARKAKGSRAAAVSSILGGVIGAIAGTILIPVPIVGTIVGGVVGAGLAAGLGERGFAMGSWGDSWRVGRGAAKGRMVSIIIKAALAIVIGVVLTVAVFVG